MLHLNIQNNGSSLVRASLDIQANSKDIWRFLQQDAQTYMLIFFNIGNTLAKLRNVLFWAPNYELSMVNTC